MLLDADASAHRPVAPPRSETELLSRADSVAGLRLGELAARLGVEVPEDLRRAKGWVGALFEKALGADAGSRSAPDFSRLGVELKTIPVDALGRPQESTFVCSIELDRIGDSEWSESRVRRKLARVLFCPVEGTRALGVKERRIGQPFLWSPSDEEEALLVGDWQELALLVGTGRSSEVTAHLGRVLQVRPKARRGASVRLALGSEGELEHVQPKGFYLRSGFTHSIIARRFA